MRLRQEFEDPLRRMLAAGAATLGTGASAWFLAGGATRVLLGVVAGLGVVGLLATLVSSGQWQSRELRENEYRKQRDADARARKSVRRTRDLARLLNDAREGVFDPTTVEARGFGCLETLRGHLCAASLEAVDLLVVRILPDPSPCEVVHTAGTFNSALVREPSGSVDDLITDLCEEGDTTTSYAASYWSQIRIDNEPYRLVAFSSAEIGEYLKSEVHRAALMFQVFAQALSDRGKQAGANAVGRD